MSLRNPRFTRSIDTGVRRISDELESAAMHAITGARPGGVHEPFLKDPHWEHAGLQLLGAPDVVLPHRDSWELPEWNYHLVIINSGFIVRSPFEDTSLMPVQSVGTLIRFSPHKLHTLTRDYRAWVQRLNIAERNDPPGESAEDPWDMPVDGFASIHFGYSRRLTMTRAWEIMCDRLLTLEALAEESGGYFPLFPELPIPD